MSMAHTAQRSDAPTPHLPSEVLEMILSFIPLLARLRVCSFVSKRWRTAALGSIKTLEQYRVSDEFARLLRLSALRFHYTSPPGLLRSVSSLTRLHVSYTGSDMSALAASSVDFRGLLSNMSTGLRHLRLSLMYDDWVCDIAKANAAHIECPQLDWSELILKIFELHFPRLKRIKFEAGFFWAVPQIIEPFVRRHAHQLEALSLGDVPSSTLEMVLSGTFPKLRKLDLSCEKDNQPLLLRVVTSLPPTVTHIAFELHSRSPYALDLIRAAGARLYRLTLNGDDMDPGEFEAALRPCIRLRAVEMKAVLCLAAAKAGFPIRSVSNCPKLALLPSLHQAVTRGLLTHADQLSSSLPQLRILGTRIQHTCDDEWHPDHIAVLHEMCAVASCKLSELVLHVQARASFVQTLRPHFRTYRWLGVTIRTGNG